MSPLPPEPPFGLSPVIPAFDRATRLAQTLLRAVGAHIVLVEGDRVWRSRNPPKDWPQRAAAADYAMETGELLWLEDAPLDPRFDANLFIRGDFRTGFYAAAPVRLSDGSIPGVLMVYDAKPRPFDRDLARGLMDLADTVADECDRARIRERAERSEQRLQLALELADIFVTDIDYERRTLETAGAMDMFDDVTTYEGLTTDPFATIDPRDREHVAQAWTQHLKDGAPYRPEFRVSRHDGREVWAVTVARAFTDEAHRITRMVGASQDITERKRTEIALMQAKEQAEVANRAKSTFLATMSHEIRTPLNGVLGMAQAMAMDALAPAQRERLEIIQSSGETLLAILNDVLDLSKIEAGKLELETAVFDIGELARGVHAVFAATAAAKDCGLALTVEPAAAGTYRGDPTRIRQILYNLISNALKFTDAGEVRLRVGLTPDGLELEVTDTGIGIAPEHMAALFRKFEQADATTTRRFGGTGLGLAICRELAHLMGGSIRVDSQPGEGATFTVTLPLPRLGDAALAPAVEPAAPHPAPASDRALRVLAAEDNKVNQQVLAALLQHVGAEPYFVENGLDAVAAWESGDWDVILMDVHMPRMDGPSATRIIREREQAAGRARTPIIALTANAMSHQVEAYAAAGMDDFVAKPIEVGRLFAALEAALAAEPAGGDPTSTHHVPDGGRPRPAKSGGEGQEAKTSPAR